MKAQNKIQWLSVSVIICPILIGSLSHYIWTLNNKVESLQTQSSSGAPMLQPSLPEPWPKDWDPWKDPWNSSGNFSALQKRMDEMMNRMMPGQSIFSNRGFGLSQSSPMVTMTESSNEYKVVVTVPEGQEVELNTELTDGVLKISGKVKKSSEESSGGFSAHSQSTSQFSQSMTLGEAINESAMKTEHNENEIVIRIPKNKS